LNATTARAKRPAVKAAVSAARAPAKAVSKSTGVKPAPVRQVPAKAGVTKPAVAKPVAAKRVNERADARANERTIERTNERTNDRTETKPIRRPTAPVAGQATPAFWDQARTELMKGDRVLRKLIPKYEGLALTSRGDPFFTLARSVVGQQISVAAAQAIWERVVALVPAFTPPKVLKLKDDKLRACGLSARKVEYLQDLAKAFDSGDVNPAEWKDWDDEAIIERLVKVRGIGRWTAEMFLIFHQLRPNVLPLDDIGLQKAVSLHYFSGERISRSELRDVAANWQPWASVATWYMWRSLDPIAVEY
jgi:DNA-3-methyladenine glycosylase II